MDIVFFIILLVVLAGGFFFLSRALKREEKKPEDRSFLLLQNQLGQLDKSLRDAVKTQFSESQKLIRDITQQLVEVKKSSEQVFGIADQLHSLEQVLKNQKQRGSLGEAGLELILGNILPPDAYRLQYGFKDGDIVDAAIMTKEGIIPVDAKFSLDNYVRLVEEKDEEKRAEFEKQFSDDLKKRINETSKYIKPKEGTLPFAFMYIPAEPIYYDLLVNEVGAVKSNTRSLIDYAYNDKKVIIVSPTTFAAYLQTVLYGFRAFKIEESAREIAKQVEMLRRHLINYDEYFKKVGGALGVTVSHYNAASREFGKVDKDILKITKGEGMGIEPLELDKPQGDDE